MILLLFLLFSVSRADNLGSQSWIDNAMNIFLKRNKKIKILKKELELTLSSNRNSSVAALFDVALLKRKGKNPLYNYGDDSLKLAATLNLSGEGLTKLVSLSESGEGEYIKFLSKVEESLEEFLSVLFVCLEKKELLRVYEEYVVDKKKDLQEYEVRFKSKTISEDEYFSYKAQIVELENNILSLKTEVDILESSLKLLISSSDISGFDDFSFDDIEYGEFGMSSKELSSLNHSKTLKKSKNFSFLSFVSITGSVETDYNKLKPSYNLEVKFSLNPFLYSNAKNVFSAYQNSVNMLQYSKKQEGFKRLESRKRIDILVQKIKALDEKISILKTSLAHKESLYKKGVIELDKLSKERDSLFSSIESRSRSVEELCKKVVEYYKVNGKLISFLQKYFKRS